MLSRKCGVYLLSDIQAFFQNKNTQYGSIRCFLVTSVKHTITQN